MSERIRTSTTSLGEQDYFSKMKIVLKTLSAVILALLVFYLSLPTPDFPDPPPGAFQSIEEADSESPFRRAYFTDLNRQEVLEWYQNQMGVSYRLNYPPEDAQTLIRDQTRSVYLEEIVHPLRESVYVNGFIPKEAKDDIWYKGTHYYQKITVKYSTSSLFIRVLIVTVWWLVVILVTREWVKVIKRIWTYR